MRRRWHRVARAAAGLGILLVLLTGMAAADQSRERAGRHSIALGTYIPEVGEHPARIDRYARLMGRRPAIVGYYKQWDYRPFDAEELEGVWRHGAVPMVTWEPMSYHGHRYSLKGIARGRYDRYVRAAARAAADWGRPLFVRFAHEMNGDWYPWGLGFDGNTPHRFKVAWRRVVRIFRSAGADNVRWVWTPNANQFGGLPFKRFYPGDRWVDWVGLDGFNWGYGGRSYSLRQLFVSSSRTLARISSHPMMIAETGTYNRRKARWIAQALGHQLPGLRNIRALVWFNQAANGIDLRFNSSRASARAFRAGARAGRYDATREQLLRVVDDGRPR